MFPSSNVRNALTACACLLVLGAAGPARANLVANGSFENYTGTVANAGDNAIVFLNAGLQNWSDASGQAEALVFPTWLPSDILFNGTGPVYPVGLAGPLSATSPDGGNFIISDGDFLTSAVYQTITGLTPGDTYVLSFYQALAQDTQPVTPPGPVSGYWQVSFGTGTFNSSLMNANGITPSVSNWQIQNTTFVASAASEVLSFLAIGTGVPPMVALDGVSLTQTPEPAALWTLAAGGLLIAWRRIASRKR